MSIDSISSISSISCNLISPRTYAEKNGIEALLNKAVNECYLVQSTCPAATISKILSSTFVSDAIETLTGEEVIDGDGGYSAELQLSLASGIKSSTIVSHSNYVNAGRFITQTHLNCRVNLIPPKALAATGANSIQEVMAALPPSAASSNFATTSLGLTGSRKVDKKAPEVIPDPFEHSGNVALALKKAVNSNFFRLKESLSFMNEQVVNLLKGLSITQQRKIDECILGSSCYDERRVDDQNISSSTPLLLFNLLGQLGAAISIVCSKAAAAFINRMVYVHIGKIYRDIVELAQNQDSKNVKINDNANKCKKKSIKGDPSPTVDAAITFLPLNIAGNYNFLGKQPEALYDIDVKTFHIPDLVITLFSTDPRLTGRLKIREVYLIVHLSNTGPNGSNTSSDGKTGNNLLSMDKVELINKIAELVKNRVISHLATNVFASNMNASLMNIRELSINHLGVSQDGSVYFNHFDSFNFAIDIVAEAVKEAGGVLGSEFSVGFNIDASSCFSPDSGKYALVHGEPELTGSQLSELLFKVVYNGGNQAKTGIVTYLEDTHVDSDVESSQRLMYRVATGPKIPDPAAVAAAAAAAVLEATSRKGGNASSKANLNKRKASSVSAHQEIPKETISETEPPKPVSQHTIVSGMNIYCSNDSLLLKGAYNFITNHATLKLADLGSVVKLLENAYLYRCAYPGASIGIAGETFEGDGAFLANLAVGIHARTIKIGGIYRSEHAAIINELVKISNNLTSLGLVSTKAPIFDCRTLSLPPAPIDPVEIPLPSVVEEKKTKNKKR